MAKYRVTIEVWREDVPATETSEAIGRWTTDAEVKGDERTAAGFLRSEADRLVPPRPTLRDMSRRDAPRIGPGGIVETASGEPLVLPKPQP